MSSTLKGNLSNRYYERRNLLNARPGLIKALVEDNTDIAIWKQLLETACPDKQFDVKPYQVGDNMTKSKQCIIEAIVKNGGPLYIGCVDSDQDYFLESINYPAGLFYPAHYLFHTYAYSVENLYCLPETLENVYVTATCFTGGFHFEEFFEILSQTVYPLVMTDLYLRTKMSKYVHKVGDWKFVFPGGDTIKKTLRGTGKKDIIEATTNNVTKYLTSLKKSEDYDETEYIGFEEQFRSRFPFITPNNCVQFVYGHEVFNFVVSIINAQRDVDVEEAKREIYNDKNMPQTVKQQKASEISNWQIDAAHSLRSNYRFMQDHCQIYQMIESDLKTALK